MNLWYKLSLVCGLMPLSTGILIFLCWLVTRAHWLKMVGLVTLYIGLGLFVIGVIFLVIYFIQSRKNEILGYWKKSSVSLLILLSNFPVYAVIMGTVIYVAGISTVIIENQSTTSIKKVILSVQGNIFNLGSVLPNEQIKKNIHFQSEGAVHYSFTREKDKYEGVMFGYVTGGMGNTAIMVITESGKVRIDEKI